MKANKRHVTGISICFVNGKYEVEVTRDKLKKEGGIYKNTRLVQKTYTVKNTNIGLLRLLFKLANYGGNDLWVSSFFDIYPSTDIHSTLQYDMKRMKAGQQ